MADNVELVRRLWSAFERGGIEAVLEVVDPEVEWTPYGGDGTVYHGHDGLREYMRLRAERNEQADGRLYSAFSKGDAVVARGEVQIRGEHGTVTMQPGWLYEFRDGKLIRFRGFATQEAALRAAGLTRQDPPTIVREVWEAFNRAQIDSMMQLFADDIEWCPYNGRREVYVGIAGAREFFDEMFGSMESFGATEYSLREIGPVVAVSGSLHLVEKTGALVQRQIHYLFWVRDGLVERAQSFARREDAMAVAEAARPPLAPPDNVRSVPSNTTASALISLDHEELVIRKGRRSGVYTIVAVHSTTLGPALGGCRMWRYASSADAARDALRLSRAMTFKAAAAGLNLGGGKSVISLPPGPPPTGKARRAVLEDFADTVAVLEGAYVTAEDVGTSSRDMSVIAERTKHVTGLPRPRGGSGDPSPFTALGVEAAMRASCERVFGSASLKGKTVAVIGAGRVGSRVARLVTRAGGKVLLADIDESKKALAKELKAKWTDPTSALLADVDIVAPCALGGMVNGHSVQKLRCQIVCGSANNQLAHDGLAEDLAERGILYAPDFIANAGGLINVATELDPGGYDLARTKRRAIGIEETISHIYDEAENSGTTPLAAAYGLARRRLAEAGEKVD